MASGFSNTEAAVDDDESVAGAPGRRTPDRLALISGAVTAGVVLVGVVLLLAAVKKGLDLTDESNYIQSEMHPREYLRSSTQFQLLLGPVLSLVEQVWLLRAVKVLGLLAAHAFFVWCFFVTAPSLIGAKFKRVDGVAVGAAVCVGALAISRVQPQTPGYNDITVFILVSASGLLLLLADRRFSPRTELAAWFGVGMIVWFQFVARWPSAAAIVPLAAIAFLWTGFELPQLLKRIGAGVAGAAVGALVTQLFLAPVGDIVRGIQQGNEDAGLALGYKRSDLLDQYVTNLSDLVREMSRSFWFLLVAAVVIGLMLGARRRYVFPIAIAAGAGLVMLTPVFILSERAHGGVEPFGGIGLPLLLSRSVLIPLYLALAILAAGAAAIISRDSRPTLRGWAIFAALLATPLMGGLGSNNPLWYSAGLNPGLWIAAALGLCSLVHRDHGRILVHGLAFAFAALIAFTAFDGTWRRPYRQPPLASATTKLHIGGTLGALSTDATTAAFLTEVRAATDTVGGAPAPNLVVSAGYPPFNQYGLPGASVASTLSQPLFAWLSAPYFIERSLAAACEDRARGVLLLQDPNAPVGVNSNPALTVACAGRSWTQRQQIGELQLWYAPPLA